MLKKDLETQVASLKSRVNFLADEKKDLEGTLTKMTGFMEENNKLQKHREEALIAIRAVMQVNCTKEYEWRSISYQIYEQHQREGKEPPTPPDLSKLWLALEHMEGILTKPLSKSESPFHSY